MDPEHLLDGRRTVQQAAQAATADIDRDAGPLGRRQAPRLALSSYCTGRMSGKRSRWCCAPATWLHSAHAGDSGLPNRVPGGAGCAASPLARK